MGLLLVRKWWRAVWLCHGISVWAILIYHAAIGPPGQPQLAGSSSMGRGSPGQSSDSGQLSGWKWLFSDENLIISSVYTVYTACPFLSSDTITSVTSLLSHTKMAQSIIFCLTKTWIKVKILKIYENIKFCLTLFLS